MKAKALIKSLLVSENTTLTEVVNRLNEKYQSSTTLSNVSNKLNRDTIQFKEVIEILDVLGYNLKPIEKYRHMQPTAKHGDKVIYPKPVNTSDSNIVAEENDEYLTFNYNNPNRSSNEDVNKLKKAIISIIEDNPQFIESVRDIMSKDEQ